MLTYDQYPAFLFVAVVTAVYVIAARSLFVAAGAKPSSKYSRWVIRGLAIFGIGCFAYGYFAEPYWPEVVRVELRTPKFTNIGPPIRIVHISDVHSDAKPRLEERLPLLIAEQQPDLILFSGDSTNSAAGLPVFRKLMTELSPIAPTYAVQGNWDVGRAHGSQLFDGTGVKELTARAGGVVMNLRGNKIWIGGASAHRIEGLEELLAQAPTDAFRIFVYHYPDEIYDVSGKVDLYCAGHTHGGQVAMPLYGALLTLSRFGKRFEAGLYQVGSTSLYVSRGIGMEGGSAPRVRFWARPEITLYEIARE